MNSYGFTDLEWQETLAVFKKYSEVEKAVLFGSRAKNTFKPMSDVDIVLYGDKITYHTIAAMQSDFEESQVPFFFDILDYKKITSDELKEHIRRYGKTIYEVNGELPKGWVETTLGEVVDLAQGVAINKKTDYVLCDKSKGVPLLKINNLLNNTVDHYVDLKLVPQKAILEKDDVIFTRTGQVGWVFTNKFGVLHNNSFKVIPNDGLNKKFLYWFLKQKSVYNYVQKVAAGSAQPDLNHGAFKTIEIRLPSDVEEQKAIAKILTVFDDKIELLQAQNKTLETTAQTIFKEWFGKYQIGDELPDGWRVGTLGEVTKIVGGTTPSTKNETFWNGETHWTSPKDLSNSKEMFLLTTDKKITNLGLKQISSGLLPKRTLLLSSRAPVGYLSLTNIQLSINQGYIAILPNQYFSNNYMYLWLELNMRTVKNAANGSTFLEISKSSFRNIDCIIPNGKILERFEELVNPIFKKILNNLIQVQSLKKTRDTLLPKLMSGEIRVNEFRRNKTFVTNNKKQPQSSVGAKPIK